LKWLVLPIISTKLKSWMNENKFVIYSRLMFLGVSLNFFLNKICRLNFWTVKLAEFIYKKCIFFSICVRFFHIIIIAIWIICYFCNHTHTSLIISAKRFSTYCSFFAFLIVRNTMVFNLKCNINQKLNVSSVVLQFVLL
jgi:hypothetical protein